MKKTTATQKKSKEVDTATEMPEQQKTRGTKSGAKRKAQKQDLPKHQKTKKPRTTPEKSLITNLEYLQTRMEKDIQRIASAITSRTEEKVKERIKSEVLSGQFGRGKVIPRFEREEERVHERIDENVQAELSDESLKKVTSVLRKMADTVVEFAEVMAEIGNTRTGGGIIKRTFENIAEMINGVSSSQPPQQQGLLDDDDIFNQPSFLDAVSAIEQAFLQTRKNYAAQPEQPTTSQSQHHIQTPSFDLGVPSPQPTAMEQPQNKIDSTELRNIARDLDEDSEKTISDEQQLDTTPEDNTMKELFDSEQLFEYAGYYLNREIFQSMRAGELESVIVDVWCLRLNQLDLNRGLDKPKRIFFSTQAFLQLDSPTNWERGENTEQSSYQTDFEQCLDTKINNVGKLDISDAQLDPYLASLRALYTSRILMMPVNVHKATVIRNAEEHFIGKRLLQ
nr:platelet glycoprotein Ib alpha chain-like [Ipomoea batatas]